MNMSTSAKKAKAAAIAIQNSLRWKDEPVFDIALIIQAARARFPSAPRTEQCDQRAYDPQHHVASHR
jgi:hypothetical protein